MKKGNPEFTRLQKKPLETVLILTYSHFNLLREDKKRKEIRG